MRIYASLYTNPLIQIFSELMTPFANDFHILTSLLVLHCCFANKEIKCNKHRRIDVRLREIYVLTLCATMHGMHESIYVWITHICKMSEMSVMLVFLSQTINKTSDSCQHSFD